DHDKIAAGPLGSCCFERLRRYWQIGAVVSVVSDVPGDKTLERAQIRPTGPRGGAFDLLHMTPHLRKHRRIDRANDAPGLVQSLAPVSHFACRVRKGHERLAHWQTENGMQRKKQPSVSCPAYAFGELGDVRLHYRHPQTKARDF